MLKWSNLNELLVGVAMNLHYPKISEAVLKIRVCFIFFTVLGQPKYLYGQNYNKMKKTKENKD